MLKHKIGSLIEIILLDVFMTLNASILEKQMSLPFEGAIQINN